MPLQAVIFDMDGLLIDSEPFWREAEINVFALAGVLMTNEMCESVMGLRLDEVIQHWYNLYPWTKYSLKEMETMILGEVKRLILEKGQLMKGVQQTLELISSLHIPMALASSSSLMLINTVISKFQLAPYFSAVCSAETETYGKPHPDIYLSAAKRLHIEPVNCLALEDSMNGIIAAKAARMKVIAIPDPAAWDNPKLAIADQKLHHMGEINPSLLKTIF